MGLIIDRLQELVVYYETRHRKTTTKEFHFLEYGHTRRLGRDRLLFNNVGYDLTNPHRATSKLVQRGFG